MQFNQQVSSLHPSGMPIAISLLFILFWWMRNFVDWLGLSQMVLYKVLEEWGDNGWQQHLQSVRAFYTAKKKDFFDACNEHLNDELVEWKEPTAGMFCWFKVKGVNYSESLRLNLMFSSFHLFLCVLYFIILIVRNFRHARYCEINGN
jgi:hypothetical protein